MKRGADSQGEAEKEDSKIKKQNAKLRNNAVFGKSIENSMNKVDVKIVTTRRQWLEWSFRPTFKREKQFRSGAIAVQKGKCRVNLNKLIYTGASIMNLTKVLIQDFHHNYIKNKYGIKAEMLLTDTDSFMYKIETENIYEVLYKDKKLFDLSNYLRDSIFCNFAEKSIAGKMNDETCGVPIKGFVVVRSIL